MNAAAPILQLAVVLLVSVARAGMGYHSQPVDEEICTPGDPWKDDPWEDPEISDQWTELIAAYRRYDGKCGVCHEPIDLNVPSGRWQPTVDHIIPLSRGGADCRTNIQIAHRSCNSRKNNLILREPGPIPGVLMLTLHSLADEYVGAWHYCPSDEYRPSWRAYPASVCSFCVYPRKKRVQSARVPTDPEKESGSTRRGFRPPRSRYYRASNEGTADTHRL